MGQDTYLDGGQILLVRLLLDPGILWHFTGEFLSKTVQIGLVKQRLLLLTVGLCCVILRRGHKPHSDTVAALCGRARSCSAIGAHGRLSAACAWELLRTGTAWLGLLPYGKWLHLLPTRWR